MLTQKDLDEIEHLIKTTVKEEIKFLPTKDEFFTKMDEVVTELRAIREDQIITTGKLSEHTDTLENHGERIVKLEQGSTVI